jgi:uncharacterized repeat protein (TIGR02543 family)
VADAELQVPKMDLTKGTSYLLVKEKPISWQANHHINLFLFVAPEPDTEARKNKLSLGLYLTFTNNLGNPIQSTAVAAGPWTDWGGSYLGYTINAEGEKENITFEYGLEHKIKSADCPYWIISNVEMEVSYDDFGNATVEIPWSWAVDATQFVNYNKPKGTQTIELESIDPKTYTITYDANGGTRAPSAQTKTHDVDIRISPTVPSRTNHTFTGWNTEPDGTGTGYTSKSTYKLNSDLTLYAQWKRTYTVEYDANEGYDAPTNQEKTEGKSLTLSTVEPIRENYEFTGWNTEPDGSGTNYAPGASYNIDSDLILYAQWQALYTSCGIPIDLAVSDNGDNTITLSWTVGNDGVNNESKGVQLFVTFDGSDPSIDNYNYIYTISGISGLVDEKIISFASWSPEAVEKYFGSGYSGPIKFTARTLGTADSAYYSSTAPAVSTDFTWYSKVSRPKFITPESSKTTIGLRTSYRISWESSTDGINNRVASYILKAYNITTGLSDFERKSTRKYYNVPVSYLEPDCAYKLTIQAIGTNENFNSFETIGYLNTKTIERFSEFNLLALDGTTLPSTDVYGYKTYIDSGCGNVLKLCWDTPVALNNKVDSYQLIINREDPSTGDVFSVLSENVGNTNEFYLNASLVSQIELAHYQLIVQVVAFSKYGTSYMNYSNPLTVHISKGCGTYVRVKDGYAQPIMKRAIALAKLYDSNETVLLTSSDDFVLTGLDEISLYAKKDIPYEWAAMQEFYAKNNNGTWQTNDIRYEVLTDINGEIITDSTNEFIYTL